MAEQAKQTESKTTQKPKLNKDGLVPGQRVDFTKWREVEAKRREKPQS